MIRELHVLHDGNQVPTFSFLCLLLLRSLLCCDAAADLKQDDESKSHGGNEPELVGQAVVLVAPVVFVAAGGKQTLGLGISSKSSWNTEVELTAAATGGFYGSYKVELGRNLHLLSLSGRLEAGKRKRRVAS